VPGHNDIRAVCAACGQVLHVVADYDGNGLASIYEGKIEKVDL
jgi:hypothetical protein